MAEILIVDDEDEIRSLLRMALEEEGYVVREAADGNAALRAYNERRPDLIITDLVMPDKEGIETIVEVRRQNTRVKIIAISGVSYNLKVAKLLGADHTLNKPFSLDEMLRLVKTSLEA